jgi:hypothetical protein
MFGLWTDQEGLNPFIVEKYLRKCTPLRGVFVIRDDQSRRERFVICGMNPGTDDGFPHSHAAEVAVVRAELPALGVEEVFFADLSSNGYVLVVEATQPTRKTETIADDVWTYTPESEVELGRLLKAMSELTWRAWEEVEARRPPRPAPAQAPPEEEQEGEPGQDLPDFDQYARMPVVIPSFVWDDGAVRPFNGFCRGNGPAIAEKDWEKPIRVYTEEGKYFSVVIDTRVRCATPQFSIGGEPFHFAIVGIHTKGRRVDPETLRLKAPPGPAWGQTEAPGGSSAGAETGKQADGPTRPVEQQ